MSDERLAEAEREFRQAVPDSYGDTRVPDWALVKLLTEFDRMRAELAEYHRLFRPDAGLSGVEDTPEAIRTELDRLRTARGDEVTRMRPVLEAATALVEHWRLDASALIDMSMGRVVELDDLLDALAERVEEAKR